MKNKDRISQRLQKAKNALFALAAQGVHAQGVNPLVSVGLYSKIVVPIALYGSELWSNITASDLSVISRFQHYAAKRIQGLPTCTRSDMAESMVGLNRLQSQIESRKLMFLHKILSLPSGSVTRDIFTRKLIMFLNDKSLVTLGFIPDICQLLSKYRLHDIINNMLLPSPRLCSKGEWKTTVKRTVRAREYELWDQRLSSDPDFTFDRILQPRISPAVVYTVSNNSSFRNNMCTIARLWCRPVALENFVCEHCNLVFQDELVHVICECLKTQTLRHHFMNSVAQMLQQDELDVLYEYDSLTRTLKLLGAPLEPILDAGIESQFLRLSYTFIVKCLQTYFSESV